MRPVLWFTAACALAALAWYTAEPASWTNGSLFRGQRTDYYNLLVDGFQAGHLYMNAEVHPGRLDPDVQVRMRSPYLMDASEYQGRYYLYFGVVPAVLVLWPYAALTGHDLNEGVAVFIAVALGFLLTVRLYAAARSRYFPNAPVWADLIAGLLLAFGPCTPSLLLAGGMYEIAIAYAYLFASALFGCLYGALHSDRPGRWLAAASLCFGLSVGCRPTFLLLGPVIAATAAMVAWPDRRSLGRCGRLAAAVLLPAAIIGLGLMAYNYSRFGDPLEFGLKYQVNALQGTGKPLASADFILINLAWYYFTPPVLSPYFPYVFPLDTSNAPAHYFGWEPIHGQWLVMLLILGLAIGAALRRRQSNLRMPRPLFCFLAVLVAAFATMALATSAFGIRSNRYMVDFNGALILLVVLLGGWLLAARANSRPIRIWRGGLALLSILAVLHNAGLALQLLDKLKHTRVESYRSLSYYGNMPAAWLTRLGWLEYGPVRFTVVFAPPPHPVYEPLIATGSPNYKDVLFAAQYPGGWADFVAYHEDYGGARSALIPIKYGHPYVFEIDLGSLYPPLDAGYFPGWADAPRELLKTFLRVSMDGQEIIRTRQDAHDAPPRRLEFGRTTGRRFQPFSGKITDVQRLPPRTAADLLRLEEPGVWRFEIAVPREGTHPLLGAGTQGAGNLLFVVPTGSTFRFGLDCWSYGAWYSEPLPRANDRTHIVEVFVGAQAQRRFQGEPGTFDPVRLAAAADRLQVWVDGQRVWSVTVPAHRDTFGLVNKGTNTQGFSTAQSSYGGVFKTLPLSADEVREAIQRNLAAGP